MRRKTGAPPDEEERGTKGPGRPENFSPKRREKNPVEESAGDGERRQTRGKRTNRRAEFTDWRRVAGRGKEGRERGETKKGGGERRLQMGIE